MTAEGEGHGPHGGLRVTINTLSVTADNEGIRTLLTGLVPALVRVGSDHCFRLICSRANADLFGAVGDKVERVVLGMQRRRVLARIWHDQVTVPLLVRRKTDVLFTPSSVASVIAPVPQVVAVPAHLALPSIRREVPGAELSAAHRLYYGPVMRFSHRRAALVTPISEYLARRLVIETGVPSERVRAILCGIDPVETARPPSERVDGRFALFVGTLYPYKNAEAAIDAFALARDRLPDGFRLVVVGRDPDGTQVPALAARARGAGVESLVELRGSVPQDTLEDLYRSATTVVLPSRAEGFGLPLLEAMARGVPVMAADRTALPEVLGDAGVLFDPDRPEDLAARLVEVACDPVYRERLAEAGRARADELSWDRAARAYLRAFEQVASTRR